MKPQTVPKRVRATARLTERAAKKEAKVTTPPEIAKDMIAKDMIAKDLEDPAERQRAGVQSLGRAFGILEEVARNRDGISLADLSKRVGLHNSTTFHLVKTMVALGYLRMDERKRYRVGRPVFALAASCLDELELVSFATPVLEDLSRATGESSHFSVRMGDSVVVLARSSGPGSFQFTDRVGVIRPAYCTALGKVMLAALRPEQLDRVLERIELEPLTPKTIIDPERLRAEIADVRTSGIAYDDGEFEPELRCCAVAVRDFTNQVAGAIGISGPVWRLSLQTLQSRAKMVEEAAARLSTDLGATSES